MVYTNPLPAARSNGSAKAESSASLSHTLSGGSSQPFLTGSQRAALDAALAAKMSSLTAGVISDAE